jgi:transcriptional regulator with XRE-family HTH domain
MGKPSGKPHGAWDDDPTVTPEQRARLRRGWTLDRLAERANCAVSAAQQFERHGKSSAALKRRMADVLGLPIPAATPLECADQLLLALASSSS